jgi:predicted nucleotidyltransferase
LAGMTSDLKELAAKVNSKWPNIAVAHDLSIAKIEDLKNALADLEVPDTSIVVFGSLARLEFTNSSDLDWTLLLDGFSVPEHLDTSIAIGQRLKEIGYKQPGREGTFGSLAPSHDIIQHIGGEDDTNSNTTRRSLILLESCPILNREAFDRVRSNLLKRYLSEDLGFWRQNNPYKIPHFLLNDFARYWRTMTVDFAYKQRSRGNDGFALRSIKLGISRKLIFMAGMIACFNCHLDFTDEERATRYERSNLFEILDAMKRAFEDTPLNIVAKRLLTLETLWPSARKLFSAYDEFLCLLNNEEKRLRLNTLKPAEMDDDPTYREAREIRHAFREAIHEIFLTPGNPISDLAIRFGVF